MFGMMDSIFAHGDQVATLADRRFEIVGGIDGFGIAMMVLGLILWITVMTALVLGIMELIRRRRAPQPGPGPAGQDVVESGIVVANAAPTSDSADALRMLDERYARGEMNHDEYLQRKRDLTGL